jgi:hypothetical protein
MSARDFRFWIFNARTIAFGVSVDTAAGRRVAGMNRKSTTNEQASNTRKETKMRLKEREEKEGGRPKDGAKVVLNKMPSIVDGWMVLASSLINHVPGLCQGPPARERS